MKHAAAVAAAGFLLVACATYRATLTNERGQTMTCEASGKNGIITGEHVRAAFSDCVSLAKAQGYSLAPDAGTVP